MPKRTCRLLETEACANMLAVLRKALWNSGEVKANEATYNEMKKHTIVALAAPILSELELPEALYQKWQKDCVQSFIYYQHCLYAQSQIPLAVPYVILKGTSSAKYYPCPYNRAMGDIDIMTRHEDFKTACAMLRAAGYEENKDMLIIDRVRHIEYQKHNTEIELHSYYAYRNDPEEARALDDLIIKNIDDSHVLPDPINGLTLIEHINFHMETGIGLRQIIDWMLFVDKCLSDAQWPSFQKLAKRTGHEKLAIIVTRMCEIFLGLPEHKWCSKADPKICEQMMEYVLACGNFGRRQNADDKVSIRFLLNADGVKSTIHYLQSQGLGKWEAARRHPVLRPLAWLYEGGRYVIKGLCRKGTLGKLASEYESSRQRNYLFDAIGVAREKKGLVFFRNGQYTKAK